MEMWCKYLVLERPWLLGLTGGGQSTNTATHTLERESEQESCDVSRVTLC